MDQVRATWSRRLAGLCLGTTATVTVLAAAVVPANAEPTGVIRSAGSAAAVSNSYLVVLKDRVRVQDVDATSHGLASRYGGKVKHVYRSALAGLAVTMTVRQARRLAADNTVAYVEQDQRVRVSDTQHSPPSWGLDRIDQRNLPLDDTYIYPTAANNVNAYILDTGIRRSHAAFGGRAVTGFDAVTSGGTAEDCQGHGTHVAGTIGGSQYGVAKGVRLTAVRVLDCTGMGTVSGVIAGIDWITTNAVQPAVANMSLGGGVSPTLDQAVQRSISSGVSYVLAAGNGDIFGRPQDACLSSPGRVPEAITVGAVDRNDARASFSNFGTCVDIFASGVGITSAWRTDDNATNTISGTSMATPHVTGAAALYLAANPTATPAQVRDALVNAATEGKVSNPGTGSPNKLLFVGGSTDPAPGPAT